ncbi:MAG: hypothetical protein JXQ67_09395 [Campylobacterales bacterium]|nr:hypothetical protein [Campylobacterales bacterium]
MKFLFLLYFIIHIAYANEPHKSSVVPYELSIKELVNIQNSAILYGSGEKMVHVFLDPLCPYSRKFLATIANSKNMLEKYSYAIYLYSIPRLHSQKSVAAVYDSSQPLNTLLDIMLQDAKLESEPSVTTQKTVHSIAEVARHLHVNKRPFLLVQE